MIDLYISETCPYCKKVMNYFDKEKIEYNKKDISNKDNLERLLQIGGISQVPFMVDGSIKMYESSDIIEYIRGKNVL